MDSKQELEALYAYLPLPLNNASLGTGRSQAISRKNPKRGIGRKPSGLGFWCKHVGRLDTLSDRPDRESTADLISGTALGRKEPRVKQPCSVACVDDRVSNDLCGSILRRNVTNHLWIRSRLNPVEPIFSVLPINNGHFSKKSGQIHKIQFIALMPSGFTSSGWVRRLQFHVCHFSWVCHPALAGYP